MKEPKERYNTCTQTYIWFCFDCDPDVFKSTEIVLKDRMTEFSMDKYGGCEFTTGKGIIFPKDSTYSDE